MTYATSRELFEAASEAARDAARCTRQLEDLEEKSLTLSKPSFEPHVNGTQGDWMGERVSAYVDRESELNRRIEEDYRLIDAANAILYGRDGIGDGLASIAPPVWADVVYHRYLALRSWEEVAWLVGYSSSYARKFACSAFEVMDANGMAATIDGRGIAEG